MTENLIKKVLDLNIPVVLVKGEIENDVNEKSINIPGKEPGETSHERYIIVYKDDIDTDEKTMTLDKISGFKSRHRYEKTFRGCSVTMNKGLLRQMMEDPDILFLERDDLLYEQCVSKERIDLEEYTRGINNTTDKAVPNWHQTITNTEILDGDNFSQLNCYILDTGILQNHTEFTTGQVILSYNAIDKTNRAGDNNGHGTAVASLVGGKTVGCAKGVKLYSVKVLNSTGSGYVSDIISGLNWVLINHKKPAVINMSLGGSFSSTLNTAVQNCLNNGIQVICAAGNEGIDASNTSPANVTGALTITAYDTFKTKPQWGNWGSPIDTFAPGVSIPSAWGDDPFSYYLVNGTSFSTPIISGIICRMLKANPQLTPKEIREALSRMNKSGEITNIANLTTTPNLRAVWDINRITPC